MSEGRTMAIKETLQAIASKLTEEQSELKAQIAGAIREADNIIDDLKSANAESKQRKEKIRELQSELDGKQDFTETEKSLKAEIERLKKIETEYTTLQTAEQTKVISQWSEKAKAFDVEKTHKAYEKLTKLKEKFSFPDGEIDYQTAKANLEKFELLESAGAFDVAESRTPNGTPPNPNKLGDMPKNSGEALLLISKK